MNEITTLLADDTLYPVAGAAVLGVTAGILAALLLVARRRPSSTGRRGEDVLTVVAAGLATAVAAQGMWRVFGHTLHMPFWFRLGSFAFLEVAMLTSALRARRNIADPDIGRAGVDGAAVWVMTGLSAIFSAMDATPGRETLVRLAPPLVAAWLWERGLSIQRQHAGRARRINWRLTPERLLVWVGVAEPTGRTATDVDAHRRILRVAKAAKAYRMARAAGEKPRKQKRALARLDKALTRAVEHAALAADPQRQQALLAQLGALYNAAALIDLSPPPPWATQDDRERDLPVPTGHDLDEDDLVRIGYDAARVEEWLTDRGLDVPTRDLPRILAEAPRPRTVRPTRTDADPASELARELATSAWPPSANGTAGPGDNSGAGERQKPAPGGVADAPRPAGDVAPSLREVSPEAGARKSRRRRRKTRRSMTEWVETTGPVFRAELARLRRQPTGHEFAEAIRKAGLGSPSASTAKNIRAEILDRSPLPDLDGTGDDLATGDEPSGRQDEDPEAADVSSLNGQQHPEAL